MKNIIDRIMAPTPKLWRRIGTAIGTLGGSITGVAIFASNHTLAIFAGICTVVGPFLTNLAVEDPKDNT